MIIRILIVFFLTAAAMLAEEGASSRITFVVKNDAGQPVTNAAVGGCFPDMNDPAHGSFEGFTDTNGVFVATGDAVIGIFANFLNNGYYSTTIEQHRDLNVKFPWQIGWNHDRWDTEISVLLKRIKNPISMYAKEVRNPYLAYIHCLGCTSSCDIVSGKFLPPHGDGEIADIAFNSKMTMYPTKKGDRGIDYDNVCEICMTNVLDGICKGKPDGSVGGKRGSSYISDYIAPAEGYTNRFILYDKVRGSEGYRGSKNESNDDQHYLYYFRIRTQTNAMGQVTNALYGKIYGQINGNFTYYLNPTPNDRNLEFDPKRNLFKHLKPSEQVMAP